MFCFLDRRSAERAKVEWNNSRWSGFQEEFLAELSLTGAGHIRDRLDANWISFGWEHRSDPNEESSWIEKYWEGIPCSSFEFPIWETLVTGNMVVLGTELRKKAYELIKMRFPDSLMFLEIGRQAALLDSHLGSIVGFIRQVENELSLDYLMNMKDANDPEFLRKLGDFQRSGQPINHADMQPHILKDSFGKSPDLRPYGFRYKLSEAEFLPLEPPRQTKD